MRAVIVSVDYGDMLDVTLGHNLVSGRFDDVLVVTSEDDWLSDRVSLHHNVHVWHTDAFFANGACFNKWAALEEALDAFGRTGWLTLLDADILLPKSADLRAGLTFGCLHGPLRRMLEHQSVLCNANLLPRAIAEDRWSGYRIHPNVNEWAGYCQVFHADDPALGDPPWHDVNYTSAGTADSWFQQKWTVDKKVRHPWECLHLGPAGARIGWAASRRFARRHDLARNNGAATAVA